MKLRHANYSTTKGLLARHVTCHVKGPFKTWLRYVNTTKRFFQSCEKKFISNLHVVDMPLNEPTIWIFFFYRAVLPDLSDSRRNQKNLRTESKAPNFQALISPSPEIFRWRIKWYGTPKKKSKCLWLVYLSYHPLNFTFSHLTVWTARPAAVLHQSDCFEQPLKFLRKSSYQKCL